MFKISRPEMNIHRIGAVQHPFKIIHTDGNGNRKPDGRPHGITAADKIPKFKHIFRINAKLFNFFNICRQGHKVLGNRMLAQRIDQPFPAGSGVCQRFNRRKSFGCHDKQRRFRINSVQNLCASRPVNIRNKIAVNVFCPILAQSLNRHHRPQIRAADTDIDNIRQFFAGITFKLAQSDSLGKTAHFGQDLINFRHNVLTVHINRRISPVSESRMQNRTVLRKINPLAFKHILNFGVKLTFPGQPCQILHCFVVNPVF